MRSAVSAILAVLAVLALGAGSAAAAPSWHAQNVGGAVQIFGIDFVDPSHGWAGDRNGSIFATSDGGETWVRQYEGAGDTAWVEPISFVDTEHGWAGIRDGSILATSDGGQTWARQESGVTTSVEGLDFVDPQHGWAATSGGEILRTDDGGASWEILDDPGLVFRNIDFVDLQAGWVSSSDGQVLTTEDGGENWIPHSSGVGGSGGLHAVDASTAYVVGVSGKITKTINGGNSWTPQDSGTTAQLNGVDFATPEVGWAVGSDGTALRTSDGGANWEPEDPGATGSLWAVSAPAPGFAYASGTGSTMRAYYDDSVPTRVEVGAPAPGTITVGQQVSFTATARTAGGQRASGFSGPAAITSTDPEAVLPSSPAFSNGNGSFVATLRNVGSRRFTVGASGATAGESGPVTVQVATPSISVTPVPGSTTLGGSAIGVRVEVTGRVNPKAGATVQFSLYQPSDPTCSLPPLTVSQSSVPTATNVVESPPYTPQAAGAYHWTAVYSGDANNADAASVCQAQTGVAKATPEVTLTAGAGGTVGSAALAASATVADRFSPESSSIRFDLHGPGGGDCTGTPVFTEDTAYPVGGGAVAPLQAHEPTETGTYRWVVSYAGDARNAAVTTPCDAAGSTAQVVRDVPALLTRPQDDVVVGSEVRGGADLQGFDPTGTLELRLYGPDDPGCAGTPLFTDSVEVDGDDAYEGATFEIERAGTYHWSSHYSGDANNEAATRGCADGPGPFAVTKADSTTVLTATPGEAEEGTPVMLRATVGGYRPGGEVVFRLGGTELGRSTLDAAGGATLGTTALPVGSHSITARYQGDADNGPSDSAAASVTVRALPQRPPSQPPASPPAPSVRIQHSPNRPHTPNPQGGPRYSFRFTDQAPGVTFRCRLDRRPFRVCTSPTVYRKLKRGRHVFQVKSVDAAGKWSPVRTVRFTVGKRRG